MPIFSLSLSLSFFFVFVRVCLVPKISFFHFFFKQVGGRLSLLLKKTTSLLSRVRTQNKEKREEREENKMASMGDDQEENIEMWKIKKVSGPCAREALFFFLDVCCVCFLSAKAPMMNDDVAFLFFSHSLSLCVSLLLVINERNEENARFRSSLSVSRFLFASIR